MEKKGQKRNLSDWLNASGFEARNSILFATVLMSFSSLMCRNELEDGAKF